MQYRILEAAAHAQPLHLHLPEEICAFENLRRDGLVAGALSTPAGAVPNAIIYGLTPDGRAVLALRKCRLERRPRAH